MRGEFVSTYVALTLPKVNGTLFTPYNVAKLCDLCTLYKAPVQCKNS